MNSIENAIENLSGNMIVNIDTVTDVTLTGGKKNPLQGHVKKVVTGSSVMIFQNKNVNGYENMVKRRLEREGKNPESFKLGARVWGERVSGTPFVAHKDKKYLEVIFLKAGKVEYTVDGVVTDIDSIQGLGQPDMSEASQGGLDDKVIVRTYDTASIRAIRASGQEFRF